jgi:hypothetical protein
MEISRINSTTKTVALIGGAFALLDFVTTSIVSAATAAAYIAGEHSLPFPDFVATILFAVAPVLISLSGLRESARVATGIMIFHVGVQRFDVSLIRWSLTIVRIHQ